MRALSLFAAPFVLAACGPATPSIEAPQAPSAVASAAAPPSASAAASASAAPSAPDVPSPYFPVIAHAAGILHLHPLQHGAAIVAGEYLGTPVILEKGEARVERRLFEGLKGVGDPPAFYVYKVAGDWPRSGTLSLNLPGERGGTDLDFTWNGSTWVKAPAQPLGDMTQEVMGAYYQGGLLGRAEWGGKSLYYLMGSRFIAAKGTSGKLPVVTAGKGGCEHRIVAYAHLANVSGDLVGIGKLCTGADDPGMEMYSQSGKGALAIERWSKGQTRSTIVELPGSADRGTLTNGAAGLREIAPGDVYVYATLTTDKDTRLYVAHGDGKTWKDVSPPADEAIIDTFRTRDGAFWIRLGHAFLAHKGGAWERIEIPGVKSEISTADLAPDDTLWAIAGDELWHRTAAGAWEQLTLPRDPQGARMRAHAVAWLEGAQLIGAEGGTSGDNYLLSSNKPGKVLDLSLPEDGQAKAPPPEAKKSSFGRVGPPTAGCKNLFAVLYKLSRVAPPDFDFPLTREAIKGHTELSDVRFAETEDAGTRYLVAFVPNLKRGKALVDLVKEKVKGATPQLLCGEPPKVNRSLDIDLRTGALRK